MRDKAVSKTGGLIIHGMNPPISPKSPENLQSKAASNELLKKAAKKVQKPKKKNKSSHSVLTSNKRVI